MHPADRTAWLACLRAPWCGLQLHDLHTIASGDHPENRNQSIRSYLQEGSETLSADSQFRLERTLSVMDMAAAQRGHRRLAEWIELTWRTLGGELCVDEIGDQNVQRYFKLLDDFDTSGIPFQVSALEAALEKLYAEPDAGDDAVEVMTIHKAKGLEWDLVIIPSLERKPKVNTAPLLAWAEIPLYNQGSTSETQVILAPVQGKGRSGAALNAMIRGIRQHRDRSEVKRLLYVAATRARERLHLFASPESHKDGTPLIQPGSLLEAMWPAAKSHLVSKANDEETPPTGQSRATLLEFPHPLHPHPLQIAASASEEHINTVKPAPPILRRLPLSVSLPQQKKHGSAISQQAALYAQKPFKRPEGSVTARTFGNAIHTFIEMLSKEIASHAQNLLIPEIAIEEVFSKLPRWRPRIVNYLRTQGLSPREVEQQADRTLHTLTNVFHHQEGRWILMPHPEDASERGLSLPDISEPSLTTHIRFDRTFLAGSAPLMEGNGHRWIIDFKTAGCDPKVVDNFLVSERQKYTQQMHTYAHARRIETGGSLPIMLGLYYPLLQRLLWWKYEEL